MKGKSDRGVAIVEFATVVRDTVLTAPDKTISGYVICNKIEPGRGSGGDFGAMVSIPGLVQ